MAAVHFSGPVVSTNGFTDASGNPLSGSSLVIGSTTISEAEIGVLDAVTKGTTANGKAVVCAAGSKTVDALTITAGTVTTLTSTTATITDLRTSVAAKTAGTTQTQAGATAITSAITLGTTGNANDGYLLPAIVAGQILIIHNLSANAAKVYANGTETLNGTAGNAGSTTLTASKTMLVFGTGAGTSVSAVMM